MSETEKLRALLDERGVEYFKHEDGEPLCKLEKADEPATSWHMGGASVCAVPIEGSDMFDLWIDHCTPEQAIAATLGAGECEMDAHGNCTACGEFVAKSWEHVRRFDGGYEAKPCRAHNYCPRCGAKVRKKGER